VISCGAPNLYSQGAVAALCQFQEPAKDFYDLPWRGAFGLEDSQRTDKGPARASPWTRPRWSSSSYKGDSIHPASQHNWRLPRLNSIGAQ
jgi:hypothetical protein